MIGPLDRAICVWIYSRSMRILCFAVLTLSAFPSIGHCKILFNTFGVDPSGGVVNSFGGIQLQGTTFSNVQDAVQFVFSQTEKITQIDFDLGSTGQIAQVTDNDAFFQFFTDSSGSPGSQIGGVSIPVVGENNSITTIQTAAVHNLILGPGTYWIVATATNPASATLWDLPAPGVTASPEQQVNGGGWSVITNVDPGVALEGQDVAPEPASGILMLTALMAVVAIKRLRHRAGY